MPESTPAVSSSHAEPSTSPSPPVPAAGQPMDAPVFVVGASRSGTTLLYHILLASGDFPLYEAETMLLEECQSKYGRLGNRRNFDAFLADWLRSKQFHRSGLDPDHFRQAAASHRDGYADLLRFFMESMARQQGKRRWAEKTPSHIKHMDTLARAFPRARFIHIIRDGRDVAISRRQLGWSGIRSRDPLNQLLFTALDWEATVRRGRQAGRKLGNRYLEVRYEDLVADTERILGVINGFADVRIGVQSLSDLAIGSLKRANSAFTQTTGGISTSAVERWRNKLTAREAACLHVAIGRTLKELGYAVPDGSPAPAPLSRAGTRARAWLYKFLIRLKRLAKHTLGLGRFRHTDLELDQT